MEATGNERLVGADRVLAVLITLGDYPDGAGLDELARAMKSPKSTVHRALSTLKRAGFAQQDARGHYVIGDQLIRLAFAHHEARPDTARIQPALESLANRFGETVHYAVLEDSSVVYRAKVDPPTGAVRLTSSVGGRNPAHSTGVGKMLLAYTLPDEHAVRTWVGTQELERRTDRTLTSAPELHAELEKIREHGYAVDDQENEVGVNCLAVPVFLASPTVPSGAISVSALAYRTPLTRLIDDVAAIRRTLEHTIPSNRS